MILRLLILNTISRSKDDLSSLKLLLLVKSFVLCRLTIKWMAPESNFLSRTKRVLTNVLDNRKLTLTHLVMEGLELYKKLLTRIGELIVMLKKGLFIIWLCPLYLSPVEVRTMIAQHFFLLKLCWGISWQTFVVLEVQ